MNRDKLIKLMMMTTSDQDGEALNALRMANNILKNEKKNWLEFLGMDTKKNNTHDYSYKPKTSKIEEQLKLLSLDRRVNGKTKQFILSLSQSFLKYGRLTEKQEAALNKIFKEYYNEEK